MERGSDKHGPRKDDALRDQLRGQLGTAGGHREEWAEAEPWNYEEDVEEPEAAPEASEASDPERERRAD